MPIYEYRCSKGHTYELAQGFDAASEHDCQRCGAPARRMISTPAVIFKGPGFYSTDNRKGYASGNGGSSSSSESSESSKTESSSEAKAEATAE